MLFHNTSYTLQCASAHSTHHIKTPLYPLLEAGIQLQTQCGDGWLRLSPSLHTGLKLMNLIPGESQKWKEALNTPLFQQDWEKYAALNDWSAAGGCRQDVECGFCFCCCWKLCQAQVTSNLSSLFCCKCRSLTPGTEVGNRKLNKECIGCAWKCGLWGFRRLQLSICCVDN